MSRELPPGWCHAPFEVLVENLDGRRVPVKASDRASRQGKYPYYGASGIIDQVEEFLFDGDYLLIAEDGANLLSRSTPIAFQAHGRFWVNNHAHITKPLHGAPLSYLESFLNSIDLAQYVTGSAQPKLTQKALNRIDVPVAPLNEQRRIVAKLEAVQDRSRRARAALDAVPPLLEKLRQSILAAAFRGDLTKDWRAKNKNVEPAEKLLARIRVERRKKWEEAELAKMTAKGKVPKDDGWKGKYKEPEPVDTAGLPELPVGWCWASLDELIVRIEAGRSPKAHGQRAMAGEPAVLKVSAVSWEEFDADENKMLLDGETIGDTPTVCAGDLLISRANTVQLVGAVVLVGRDHPNLMLSDKTLKLVPSSLKCPAALLVYALRTRQVRKLFEEDATGTSDSMRNLSQDKLRAAPIPLPPELEIPEIVAVLDSSNARRRSLQSLGTDVAGGFTTLDRALLAKAFRGELVPQDPNDEPAEAMLARLGARKDDARAPEAGAKTTAKKRAVRA